MAWVSDPQIPTSVLRTSACPGDGSGIGALSSRTPRFGSATARRIGLVGCADVGVVGIVVMAVAFVVEPRWRDGLLVVRIALTVKRRPPPVRATCAWTPG